MSDSLGEARGRILIDTAGVRAAQQEVAGASRAMNTALGAIGVSLTAAGFVQLARATAAFAIESDKIATAYRRQGVAAENLAGSQGQLNELLEAYAQATGGAVDKASALENVTKLMAVGFADSAEELDQFARAIRGISLAMGATEDTVTQNLILELFTQRGARLDQLGLQYDKVRQRADELRAADNRLTQQQAYQAAVLEQAQERFGALTESVEGQKTEAEKLRIAWKNLRLEMAQEIQPNVEEASNALNDLLNLINRVREANQELHQDAIRSRAIQEGQSPPILSTTPFTDDSQFGLGGRAGTRAIAGRTQEQKDAITEWSREVSAIEKQANRDRLDATRQYEQQRADIIRQYGQTIVREAQDFALARARAEEDYARGLERFRRDIAQREARQLEDLERTIAEARTDAAEQAAERQVALEERLAEARATSRERVAEMEEEYQRRRERAARDHQEGLIEAASRLDAVAVARQQRDFLKRRRDEQQDFEARLEKERKNEAKRLADLEKANAKQVENDQRALDKRIRQAQEAYQRQLEDARAADEQRLSDMSADFALRQAREDEDRAIRLERLREDHEAQLAEQARAHLERIVEINRQEAEETRLANEAFDERMAALNIFHESYLERQRIFQTRGLIAYQEFLDAQEAELARRTAIQGPAPSNPMIAPPGQFPTLATPSSVTTSNRTANVIVNQQIIAAPGQSPYDVGAEVRHQFEQLLREINN